MNVTARFAAHGGAADQGKCRTLPASGYPIAIEPLRSIHAQVAERSSVVRAAGSISVIAARTDEHRAAAWELVARRYAWRGYSCSDALTPFPDVARAQFYSTLLAYRDGVPVGTVTLGVDSEAGLLVDEGNKPQVDGIRSLGRRASELVRLAIEDGAGSKQVWLALLESLNYLCWRIHDLNDIFIEVNPRHVTFYRRIFGFRVIAPLRKCVRVGAPSVLMRLRREMLQSKLQHLHRPVMQTVGASVGAITRVRDRVVAAAA
jgi:hypothetical protein